MDRKLLRTQTLVLLLAIVLFFIKLAAYYITYSVAIYTDALESVVNIITGGFGLYSLYLAGTPRDKNHPYGHGKIEFLTATVEGVLIGVAALLVLAEAIFSFSKARVVTKIDIGLIFISITAVINYGLGYYLAHQGHKVNSLQLEASGKHLQADSYTTFGIIVGLLFMYFTDIKSIDLIISLVIVVVLLYTSYKIVRKAISGIMDEADEELLNKAVIYFEKVRQPNWVDIHNLRIIKYGRTLHFDCHVTVPWYFNVNEAHSETAALENSTKEHFGESIELFIHTDGCMPFSCKICQKTDCNQRLESMQNRITWTLENISNNKKHGDIA